MSQQLLMEPTGETDDIHYTSVNQQRGCTLLILRIGNIMNAGFEQVQVFLNDYIRPTIDIFDTFVYRRGIKKADYSYSTAVGLFKSVVSLILIVTADRVAKLVGEEGLIYELSRRKSF